jgi:hypothetical protein
MKRCLNEKELVTLHAGVDDSSEARIHLESCLNCARRYRDLQGEMETLIAVLRQPRPYSIRPRSLTSAIPWSRGLGWSLAASAIVAAFVFGRVTGAGTQDTVIRAHFSPAPTGVSSSPQTSSAQVAMADGDGVAAPAAYGLYIDDLMGSDTGDQGQAADEHGPDDQADAVVGEF